MQTASPTNARRNSATELPNTFCVLMLFIRIGASDVLKLVKLIPAITMTSRATKKSRRTVPAFPHSKKSGNCPGI